MKKTADSTLDREDLLADNQTWLNILEPEFCKAPAAVESLARLLFVIKKEINSGPKGVITASKVLSNGIEVRSDNGK